MSKKVWKEEDIKSGMVFFDTENKVCYTTKGCGNKVYLDLKKGRIRYATFTTSFVMNINNGINIYLPMYDTKLGRYLCELNTTKTT